MKTITEMTRKEFEALPGRDWNKDIGPFDSMVILPSRRLHDSGYRCMDFVAVKKMKPVCRLAGASDVVHFNGIGGYGKNWINIYGSILENIPVIDWNIDCLPKSGLIHIFTHACNLYAGDAFSSFELFAKRKISDNA